MILSIRGLDFKIEISEKTRPVIQILNKQLLRGVIEAIYYKLTGGETNEIIVMDKEKNVSFPSSVYILDSPNALEINSKKHINQLYKRIEEMLNISYDTKLRIMNCVNEISCIIDKESMNLSFDVHHDDDLSTSSLLKALNYKIDSSLTNILERLYSFIDIVCEFRSYELLIFIDITFYLNDAELEKLFGYMECNKILFLLIESKSYSRLSNETVYLVDEELFESVDYYFDS